MHKKIKRKEIVFHLIHFNSIYVKSNADVVVLRVLKYVHHIFCFSSQTQILAYSVGNLHQQN